MAYAYFLLPTSYVLLPTSYSPTGEIIQRGGRGRRTPQLVHTASGTTYRLSGEVGAVHFGTHNKDTGLNLSILPLFRTCFPLNWPDAIKRHTKEGFTPSFKDGVEEQCGKDEAGYQRELLARTAREARGVSTDAPSRTAGGKHRHDPPQVAKTPRAKTPRASVPSSLARKSPRLEAHKGKDVTEPIDVDPT